MAVIICFVGQSVPSLAIGNSFTVAPVSFLHAPINFQAVSYSLSLPEPPGIPGVSCTFSAPALEGMCCSRELSFFWWEDGSCRSPDASVACWSWSLSDRGVGSQDLDLNPALLTSETKLFFSTVLCGKQVSKQVGTGTQPSCSPCQSSLDPELKDLYGEKVPSLLTHSFPATPSVFSSAPHSLK